MGGCSRCTFCCLLWPVATDVLFKSLSRVYLQLPLLLFEELGVFESYGYYPLYTMVVRIAVVGAVQIHLSNCQIGCYCQLSAGVEVCAIMCG